MERSSSGSGHRPIKPGLRRRTSSHGEVMGRVRQFLDVSDDLDLTDDLEPREYGRRRVVSFSTPRSSTGSFGAVSMGNSSCTSSPGGSNPSIYLAMQAVHNVRIGQWDRSRSGSGSRISSAEDDTPSGFFSKVALRKRIKSLSGSMGSASTPSVQSDSPTRSTTPDGSAVSSLLKMSLMKAAWPLSVSSDNIVIDRAAPRTSLRTRLEW